MFLTLNDGRTINLVHISNIDVRDTDVVYYPARGSLDGIIEHFESNEEAKNRYIEVQGKVLA